MPSHVPKTPQQEPRDPSPGQQKPRQPEPWRPTPAPRLRASDRDRNQVGELLTAAYAEGRLTDSEFEERMITAAQTRDFDELIKITSDLVNLEDPSPGVTGPDVAGSGVTRTGATRLDVTGAGIIRMDVPGSEIPAAPPSATENTERSDNVIAILSSASRTGAWSPPPRIQARALLGEVTLDLGAAQWPGERIEVDVLAGLGSVKISVPADVQVVNQTSAILGGTEVAPTPPHASGRKLILTGATVLGGIEVKRSSAHPPHQPPIGR